MTKHATTNVEEDRMVFDRNKREGGNVCGTKNFGQQSCCEERTETMTGNEREAKQRVGR